MEEVYVLKESSIALKGRMRTPIFLTGEYIYTNTMPTVFHAYTRPF